MLKYYGRIPANRHTKVHLVRISVVDNRKPNRDLRNTSEYNVLLYLAPFRRDFNVKDLIFKKNNKFISS